MADQHEMDAWLTGIAKLSRAAQIELGLKCVEALRERIENAGHGNLCSAYTKQRLGWDDLPDGCECGQEKAIVITYFLERLLQDGTVGSEESPHA